MNKTIWKVELTIAAEQLIQIPVNAELLCAREQHGEIFVWFRCNPNAIIERRKFAVVGTGRMAPIDGRYLGTAFLDGGHLVYHIFGW